MYFYCESTYIFLYFSFNFVDILNIRYGFSNFLLGMDSWRTVFVSFIFSCKKNMELIFLEFRNSFVWYLILLYANFHKLWYITIHRIFHNILCFPIRIHVNQSKIEIGIISKLVNQFLLQKFFQVLQKVSVLRKDRCLKIFLVSAYFDSY